MEVARRPEVHVVSPCPQLLRHCDKLLQGLGYGVCAYPDGAGFAAYGIRGRPQCLVLDYDLADHSAFDVQRRAQNAAPRIPVVGVSAASSVVTAVRAMKEGAIDFLDLPLDEAGLAQAVARAIHVADGWRASDGRRMRARALLGRLTPRERAVFSLVLDGKLNKQIADCLDSREATVKVHRSRLMRKLEVRSLVELLRFGSDLDADLAPDAAAARPAGTDHGRIQVVTPLRDVRAASPRKAHLEVVGNAA